MQIKSRYSPSYFDAYRDVRNGQYRGYCHPDLAEYLESDTVANLLKHERRVIVRKLKRNIVMDIRMVYTDHEAHPWVTVKAQKSIGPFSGFIARILGSKASRSCKTAISLIEAGLDTPLPLGYIERIRKGRVVENYFFSESLTKALDLRQSIADNHSDTVPQLMEGVAVYARTLHDHGIMHRDLNLRNFIVHEHEQQLHLALIDLNRSIHWRQLPVILQIRDISRLYWKQFRDEFFFLYCDGRKSYLMLKWYFDFYLNYRRRLTKLRRLAR